MPNSLTADTDAPQAADIVALLRRISAQLEALPAAIAAGLQQDKPALPRADRQALAALLPAIASSSLASMVFTAADAVEHVRGIAGVEAALTRAIGALDDRAASRRMGKLLSRAEGVVFDDLHIARRGPSRDGVLWEVTRV